MFFGSYEVSQKKAEVSRILAPVLPPMIWCVGANYRLHVEESNVEMPTRPLIFMKGTNTLQRSGAPVYYPTAAGTAQLDYEGELAVVIGKTCRNVTSQAAMDYILGYTCANDISARDWQLEWGEGQWVRGKSFDTFCPLGPCLVTPDEIESPGALAIENEGERPSGSKIEYESYDF